MVNSRDGREWAMGYNVICGPSFSTNSVATLCPPSDYFPEAENLLKTKDQERRFLNNEAGNILKAKAVTKICRTTQIA